MVKYYVEKSETEIRPLLGQKQGQNEGFWCPKVQFPILGHPSMQQKGYKKSCYGHCYLLKKQVTMPFFLETLGVPKSVTIVF